MFLAELYLPQRKAEERRAVIGTAEQAVANATRDGVRVRLVRSVTVPDDEMCLLFFEAESREAVVRMGEAAGLSFDRVIEALD